MEKLAANVLDKLTPTGVLLVILAFLGLRGAQLIVNALQLRQARSLNRKARRREVKEHILPMNADPEHEVTNPGRPIRHRKEKS